MRQLTVLSINSLLHAEIIERRLGVELLTLAMLFAPTSDLAYHKNQVRLGQHFVIAIAYEGRAEMLVEEIAGWKATVAPRKKRKVRRADSAYRAY